LNWLVGTFPVTAGKGTEARKEFAKQMSKLAKSGPQDVNVATGWPTLRLSRRGTSSVRLVR